MWATMVFGLLKSGQGTKQLCSELGQKVPEVVKNLGIAKDPIYRRWQEYHTGRNTSTKCSGWI